jgi:Fe-S cluster assembly protein SufD
LEILTGNIVGAGHASATGQLEESQLFYLLSRGIDLDRARQMILTGFLSKQIDLIGDERISSNFKELISIPELEVDKTN